MKKFPTLMVVAVSVIALCLPAFCHAASFGVSVAQKTVQKGPIQKIPDLKVEMPTPVQQKQIQKTPVQKEVIKGTCKGPCCQQIPFRFRSRTVIRERGRLLSRPRGNVSVRAPGVRVTVGGGCCR